MTSRHSSSDEFSISTLPSKTNYRNRVESLTHYLYDRNQGTVLGCTPLRICKLFCFYFVFYLALILFTVILGGVFYQILDWNIPTVIGPDSILNGNPGLAFRPQPNYLRTFIHYKKGDGPSTRPYIDNIESLIQFYENENQQVRMFLLNVIYLYNTDQFKILNGSCNFNKCLHCYLKTIIKKKNFK